MSVPASSPVESPGGGPPVEAIAEVFDVYEIRTDGEQIHYYDQPLVARDRLLEHLWPVFRETGYEVQLTRRSGEYVLVASPHSVGVDGVPWTNIVLALLTVVSTLFAGAGWYHINAVENPLRMIEAWPFTVAVMGVLGVHEFGHYVMTRYHRVNASLPYFIPIPSIIGTMGAIIRMRGKMPDREALFDIGVAGPLAGLVATVVVTVVGLFLSPVAVPEVVAQSGDYVTIQLGYPPLLQGLSWLTGQPLSYGPGQSVHPIVIGGWVGMLVTFLNLLPVGQLDGGHVVRAVFGDVQETVAALVPATLFGLAAYLHYVDGVALQAVFLWVFWGIFLTIAAVAGPATPVDDAELDARRKVVGVVTLVLGALCFTPVPITIVG